MKLLFILIFVFIIYSSTKGGDLYFPPINGTQWETIDPIALNWDTSQIDELYTFLFNNKTKAFLVLNNGKIVLEKYFGKFDVDSIWYWASAGKTITATLIGIAQKEGLLSIYDKTSKYLGEGWTVCEKENLITIRHQLTMTSGLDDNVPDKDCTNDTCLKCLADPGTRWAYHNAPYTLLERIIANSTSKSINQYFLDKIYSKTGMSGLFIKSGYNNLFVSTPRAMARFGLLILNKGYWEYTPVLEDYNYYKDMINPSQSYNESYGYLWWLNGKNSFMIPGFQLKFQGMLFPEAPSDMISALGKNGQILDIVPSKNLIVIRMGEAPGDSRLDVFLFNNEIWKFLNKIIPDFVSVKQNDNRNIIIEQDKITSEIKITTMSDCKIKIYDFLGRIMFAGISKGCITINKDYLGRGIYFALIEYNINNSYVLKLYVE